MDYLNNIVPNLISWFSLQWQSNLFRISFIIVISIIILAITFVAILKTKKSNIKNDKQNATNTFDPNFKVVEEIIKTDSKNIIA